MIVVGIDPGVETGFAIWDPELRKLTRVESTRIHQAMESIRQLPRHLVEQSQVLVIFEDARQRHFFTRDAKVAKFGAGVREGVGSIKRDCSIWEHFLEDQAIPFLARRPTAGTTKWKADRFQQMTGWMGRTNEHARDAAIIVFGMNLPIVKGLIRDFHSRMGSSA